MRASSTSAAPPATRPPPTAAPTPPPAQPPPPAARPRRAPTRPTRPARRDVQPGRTASLADHPQRRSRAAASGLDDLRHPRPVASVHLATSDRRRRRSPGTAARLTPADTRGHWLNRHHASQASAPPPLRAARPRARTTRRPTDGSTLRARTPAAQRHPPSPRRRTPRTRRTRAACTIRAASGICEPATPTGIRSRPSARTQTTASHARADTRSRLPRPLANLTTGRRTGHAGELRADNHPRHARPQPLRARRRRIHVTPQPRHDHDRPSRLDNTLAAPRARSSPNARRSPGTADTRPNTQPGNASSTSSPLQTRQLRQLHRHQTRHAHTDRCPAREPPTTAPRHSPNAPQDSPSPPPRTADLRRLHRRVLQPRQPSRCAGPRCAQPPGSTGPAGQTRYTPERRRTSVGSEPRPRLLVSGN